MHHTQASIWYSAPTNTANCPGKCPVRQGQGQERQLHGPQPFHHFHVHTGLHGLLCFSSPLVTEQKTDTQKARVPACVCVCVQPKSIFWTATCIQCEYHVNTAAMSRLVYSQLSPNTQQVRVQRCAPNPISERISESLGFSRRTHTDTHKAHRTQCTLRALPQNRQIHQKDPDKNFCRTHFGTSSFHSEWWAHRSTHAFPPPCAETGKVHANDGKTRCSDKPY